MIVGLLAISFLGLEISWLDVLDIAIVAFLIYQLLLIVRGTGAVQLGLGVLFLIFIFFASEWLRLNTLHWTLTRIFPYLVFIIIILFQHEIRKAVSVLGQNPLIKLFASTLAKEPLDEIVFAVTAMASKRIGALIVLERDVGLKNYIEGGIAIDAKVSYDLLMSIFNPASPLHDGRRSPVRRAARSSTWPGSVLPPPRQAWGELISSSFTNTPKLRGPGKGDQRIAKRRVARHGTQLAPFPAEFRQGSTPLILRTR